VSRREAQLDELARAVADGVPRRVVVGRIAAFMGALLVGGPAEALGAKRCPKGRKRCGHTCCKPGFVCRTKKGKKHCVCPKPKKVVKGRCVKPPVGNTQPVPTCTDGVRNGNETDVDCGGPTCPKCANGKACAAGTDCQSGVCTNNVCVAPAASCSDTRCGGDCPPCANGQTCAGGPDCQSGHCVGGTCRQCGAAGDCSAITAAACHKVVCESGTCGQAVDDSNLPASGQCTTGTCTGGTPSQPPAGPGTPCPGGTCDGSGTCVPAECAIAADCPGTDTECATRTCVSGTCGWNYTPDDTAVSSQTAGDCQKNVCDGAGNIVSRDDPSDLPAPEGECDNATCSGGTPSHAPKPNMTSCSIGACNGSDFTCHS
jgi:hypothetical protein